MISLQGFLASSVLAALAVLFPMSARAQSVPFRSLAVFGLEVDGTSLDRLELTECARDLKLRVIVAEQPFCSEIDGKRRCWQAVPATHLVGADDIRSVDVTVPAASTSVSYVYTDSLVKKSYVLPVVEDLASEKRIHSTLLLAGDPRVVRAVFLDVPGYSEGYKVSLAISTDAALAVPAEFALMFRRAVNECRSKAHVQRLASKWSADQDVRSERFAYAAVALSLFTANSADLKLEKQRVQADVAGLPKQSDLQNADEVAAAARRRNVLKVRIADLNTEIVRSESQKRQYGVLLTNYRKKWFSSGESGPSPRSPAPQP